MAIRSISTRFGTPFLALLLAGSIGAGLIGCEDATQDDANPTHNDPAPGEEIRSEKQRVANPEVAQSEQDALVAGNTEFALDLYKQIAGQDKNLFFSPFSISEALAMTYAGARGETGAQMADTLHFSGESAQIHPAFNWLDAHLMNLAQEPVLEESEPFELAIANSIWGQTGYHFEADFLDTLALNYGAGLNTLDFSGAPDASREAINHWVEQKTKERIKDLIPRGMIDSSTRLVLTNAIYFKASWLYPFEKERTAPGDFRRRDDSSVSANLMHQTAWLKYAELDGFRALELPYDGGDVSMLILLPEDLDAFEQNLNSEVLSGAISALESTSVSLTLPKFEYTLPLPLTETLQEMGITDAFGGEADFSGMTGDRSLHISNVVHKAFVAVDEDGTEAAAATAVIMNESASPDDPVDFRVDKPFVFMIRANQTGSLLFVGRVLDPSASE